jgi:hypothetical protein
MQKVLFNGVECDVVFGEYENGRTAIKLTEQGSPFATATINDTSVHLDDGLVMIKDYSENTGMVQALQNAGIVQPLYPYPIGPFNSQTWVCSLHKMEENQ